MNVDGESDSLEVAVKPPNKAAGGEAAHTQAEAEVVEPRGLAEGNTEGAACPGPRAGPGVSQGLDRVRRVATEERKTRFTALLHHINVDRLRESYKGLNPKAAAGVDGQTWAAYGENLEERLQDLHGRVHRGAYRAQPVRRVYIPKADGRQRPIGITALEDKIIQGAMVAVMNAIYEADFLEFSYGFRPGRSQHDALDALAMAIDKGKVNWVLDADIRDFFTSLDQEWMEKFLQHRIGDERLLRLNGKFLKAGVMEEGTWHESNEGTPQGGSISPLLANVYLHYVFDLWAEQWKRGASGEMHINRFADDIIVCFQHRAEAERFQAELGPRLAKFGLELNAEKTRLIEFGRFAARDREARGEGKPETFEYLGFTHICGTSRRGRFTLQRRTIKKRMRAKLKQVKAELKRRRHQPISKQGEWLRRVVQGHLNYYAVPGNIFAVADFRDQVRRHWFKALRRRSQRTRVNWERMGRIATRWLPRAHITRLPYWKRLAFDT